MTERQYICIVMTIGAAVGAVTSYLLFTERGSAVRHRLLPALDDFEHELNHFRSTVTRAAGVAGEGWKMLNQAIDEVAPPTRSANPHHSIPF